MNTKISFVDGCGNSFIVVENVEAIEYIVLSINNYNVDSALIIELKNKNENKHLYEMKVLEKDGSFSEFCGNGARALAAYFRNNYDSGYQFSIITPWGELPIGECSTRFFVDLPFPIVNSFSDKFSIINESPFDYADLRFYKVQIIEPHIVIFSELDDDKLVEIGERVNQDRVSFPYGMNVNSAKILNRKLIYNKTYERGVNDLTKSCGSGSASAIGVALWLDLIELPCTVRTPGGDLHFSKSENGIRMSGKALASSYKV